MVYVRKNKRLILFFTLLLIFSPSIYPGDENPRPKVALVLSGGGARGFAHIGVLKVLEEKGIPVDLIVGTSIGSVIGGFFSIGYNADQLKEFAREQDWNFLLSDQISREFVNIYEKDDKDRYIVSFTIEPGRGPIIPSGLIQGQNIINLFCDMTMNYHMVFDFNQLPIPFACVATDLATGEEIIINKGFLPEAMASSMTIPTVFVPQDRDDHIIVDGGIVNNFPVDVARKLGAEIVIGVNIGTGLLKKEEIAELTDVIGQLTTLLDYQKNMKNRDICDVIIEPDVSGFGTLSFSQTAVDTLFIRGYNSAMSKVDTIISLLDSKNIPLEYHNREYHSDSTFTLKNLNIRGFKETTINYIADKIDLEFPNEINLEEVHSSINKLFGTNSFNKSYYRIYPDEKVFEVIVQEKNSNSLNVSFNYNTMDNAAVLLNLTFRNNIVGGARLSLDAILSSNPKFKASFQFLPEDFLNLGVDLQYKYLSSVNIFENENEVGNATIGFTRGDIYTFEEFGRNFFLGMGVRAESFFFHTFYTESEMSEPYDYRNANRILSLFGRFRTDNLDNLYYPTSGGMIDAEFVWSADKLENVSKSTKTASVLFKQKKAIRLGGDVHFVLSSAGRLILDKNIDLFEGNFIGGTENNSYLDEHLPFIGVKRVTPVKDKIFIGRTDLRIRLGRGNHLSFIFNAATHYDEIKTWQVEDMIFGGGIKYSYESIIGPIEFLISTSDYTKDVDFYLSIGKWF